MYVSICVHTLSPTMQDAKKRGSILDTTNSVQLFFITQPAEVIKIKNIHQLALITCCCTRILFILLPSYPPYWILGFFTLFITYFQSDVIAKYILGQANQELVSFWFVRYIIMSMYHICGGTYSGTRVKCACTPNPSTRLSSGGP